MLLIVMAICYLMREGPKPGGRPTRPEEPVSLVAVPPPLIVALEVVAIARFQPLRLHLLHHRQGRFVKRPTRCIIETL